MKFITAIGLGLMVIGVAPGHKERTGTQALRTGLTPLAHAAARTKGTSLSALS
jgi:hypothetical protein